MHNIMILCKLLKYINILKKNNTKYLFYLYINQNFDMILYLMRIHIMGL